MTVFALTENPGVFPLKNQGFSANADGLVADPVTLTNTTVFIDSGSEELFCQDLRARVLVSHPPAWFARDDFPSEKGKMLREKKNQIQRLRLPHRMALQPKPETSTQNGLSFR